MCSINDVTVGDWVKFTDDVLWFHVQARNSRYIILNRQTKLNLYHTIVDLDQQIRGDDNLVFHQGYDTKLDCENRLNDHVNGDIEISHRNQVKLSVHKIDRKGGL